MDLHNILFETLENLNDRSVSGEELEVEMDRSRAICSVSEKIIDNAKLQLKAAEIANNFGTDTVPQNLIGVKNDN